MLAYCIIPDAFCNDVSTTKQLFSLMPDPAAACRPLMVSDECQWFFPASLQFSVFC